MQQADSSKERLEQLPRRDALAFQGLEGGIICSIPKHSAKLGRLSYG